jgi:hypothetical protein
MKRTHTLLAALLLGLTLILAGCGSGGGSDDDGVASATGTDFVAAFQRLRIRLKTKVAAGTAQIDTTFTALNTLRNHEATNVCSEGRPH